MVRVRSPRDFFAGILFCVIAAGAIWQTGGLEYGSLRNMGSGFFPRWLAILLLALGAFIASRGLAADGPPVERISTRLAVPILASVIVFGFAINSLGLIATIVLSVAVAALGGRVFRATEILLLAAGMAVFCALLFVYGLNLPIDLLPTFLRK